MTRAGIGIMLFLCCVEIGAVLSLSNDLHNAHRQTDEALTLADQWEAIARETQFTCGPYQPNGLRIETLAEARR
jgi:hypothetical protein